MVDKEIGFYLRTYRYIRFDSRSISRVHNTTNARSCNEQPYTLRQQIGPPPLYREVGRKRNGGFSQSRVPARRRPSRKYRRIKPRNCRLGYDEYSTNGLNYSRQLLSYGHYTFLRCSLLRKWHDFSRPPNVQTSVSFPENFAPISGYVRGPFYGFVTTYDAIRSTFSAFPALGRIHSFGFKHAKLFPILNTRVVCRRFDVFRKILSFGT